MLTRLLSKFLIALIVLVTYTPNASSYTGTAWAAQEEEAAGAYKPESEKTPEEREFDKEANDVTLKGKPTRVDNATRALRKPIVIGHYKVCQIHFERRGPGYQVTVQIDQKTAEPLNLSDDDLWELGAYIEKSDSVLYNGDLPTSDAWRTLLKKYPNNVLSSRVSPNQTIEEKAAAVALGSRRLKPDELVVMNALPRETTLSASLIERNRMGITGSRKDWQAINHEIALNLAPGTRHEGATKNEFLKELGTGTKDVLIIFAHSDSNVLYLPGIKGGSVSVDDLKAIRRDTAPDRLIILFACEAGTVNAPTRSLAEALLENRLAKSVVASDRLLDAQDIPQLLTKIFSGISIREATAPLHQIVAWPTGEVSLRPVREVRRNESRRRHENLQGLTARVGSTPTARTIASRSSLPHHRLTDSNASNRTPLLPPLLSAPVCELLLLIDRCQHLVDGLAIVLENVSDRFSHLRVHETLVPTSRTLRYLIFPDPERPPNVFIVKVRHV